MAERRENSVLIALRELRGVEESRVETQAQQRQAAADQTRSETEAKAQAVRDEEQRVLQEAADDEQAQRDAVEAGQREERMHAQAAENAARDNARMVIENERSQLEMAARAVESRKKMPVGLIVGAVALLLVIGGLGIFVMNQNEQERINKARLAAQATENARIKKESAANIEEAEAQVKAMAASKSARGKLLQQIDNTTDPAELKRLFELVAAEKRKEVRAQEQLEELRRKQKRNEKRRQDARDSTGPKCDPTDPLCGS